MLRELIGMERTDGQFRRGFVVLAITAFATSLSMGIQQSILPNFLREEIGMDGAQNGYLVALREIPGLLLAFVAAMLLRLGMARATGAGAADHGDRLRVVRVRATPSRQSSSRR